MTAFVGTSGWAYKRWKSSFYEGRPEREWLAFAAQRFTALEINASFYRLQREETFRRWRDIVPQGFRFALKGHRFITHNKKLLDVAEAVARSRDNAAPLGDLLAVVLWQLPAQLPQELVRLLAFMRALEQWPGVRHALELRHASWFQEETAAVLADAGIAVVQSDAPTFPLWDEVTTDLVYVRLHGHERLYASSYSEAQLEEWAARVRSWQRQDRDVYVFFDNDQEAAAPRNAQALRSRLMARNGSCDAVRSFTSP